MGLLLFFLSMLFIALLIVLFSYVASLRRSVDALKKDLADLRRRVDGTSTMTE